MFTVLAFVFALALLIAVHEYGHYRVAVACGVKVLRFSIGFGPPLLKWRGLTGTEYVVAALPLGGYVRMLDEREGPVSPDERHLAFNLKPLRARAAVVAAGPMANLLLAVVLYAGVAWWGETAPEPVVATPVVGSLADRAGLRGGERVLQVAAQDAMGSQTEEPRPVQTFDELRWALTQAALGQQNLRLWVAEGPQALSRDVFLPLSELSADDADQRMFDRIGIVAPWSAPVLGELVAGGAAAEAGLQPGDLVIRVDGRPVADAQQLRLIIRHAVGPQGSSQAQGVVQRWEISRHGRMLNLEVTPKMEMQAGLPVGRVGAYIGAAPAMVDLDAGLMGGLLRGFERTWDVSALSLQMMWKMLTGEASVKHLSGPLTIADYAGKSAAMGWLSYVVFVALISVSLGVLNLLPLPVLDGGHLMYYLWEAVTGRPVSDLWTERLQRGGVAVLAVMMSVAVFNDLARLLG